MSPETEGLEGGKKGGKARGVLVFSRTFYLGLMGVVSGHGNPIKRSRDRKTIPEEEVEQDWGQKTRKRLLGKLRFQPKKKKKWNSKEEQG